MEADRRQELIPGPPVQEGERYASQEPVGEPGAERAREISERRRTGAGIRVGHVVEGEEKGREEHGGERTPQGVGEPCLKEAAKEDLLCSGGRSEEENERQDRKEGPPAGSQQLYEIRPLGAIQKLQALKGDDEGEGKRPAGGTKPRLQAQGAEKAGEAGVAAHRGDGTEWEHDEGEPVPQLGLWVQKQIGYEGTGVEGEKQSLATRVAA